MFLRSHNDRVDTTLGFGTRSLIWRQRRSDDNFSSPRIGNHFSDPRVLTVTKLCVSNHTCVRGIHTKHVAATKRCPIFTRPRLAALGANLRPEIAVRNLGAPIVQVTLRRIEVVGILNHRCNSLSVQFINLS